jgi:hypothetical protein
MINIKETFLTLTKRRYPKGTEDLAMEVVKSILPDVEFTKDEFDNYYTYIPKDDGTDSDTMFTSHLDTIDSGPYGWRNGETWDKDLKKYVKDPDAPVDDKSVNHVFDGDFVKTDGESNLGADDKTGTTIMMNMISEKVPGLYYFFMGEESGCVGSSNLSRVFESKQHPTMNKCISFDRRGYDSIITEQTSVCASDEFAKELAKRFNEYGFWFKPDPTGVYTDSAEFTDIIHECSNISCGYFSEHTKSEKQDLEFLELLAIVSTQIDWETLPIVRDKDKVYMGKKSKSYRSYGGWNNWDDDYGYGHNGYSNKPYTGTSKHSSKSKSVIPKTYEDNGDGNLVEKKKISTTDFDFDQWYGEMKTKSWETK